MPWVTIDNAARQLHKPVAELEKRIADGEIRSRKSGDVVFAFVSEEVGQPEGSIGIDTDRFTKAVERIVAAAQELENLADAQSEKLKLDHGIAATLDGAIQHLKSVGKRSELEARAEARRARWGERRARRWLRLWNAVGVIALLVVVFGTVAQEGRIRRALQAVQQDRIELTNAIDRHQARLEHDYEAFAALIDGRCVDSSEIAATETDLVGRIESNLEQFSAVSDRLVCELEETRAGIGPVGRGIGSACTTRETTNEEPTLEDVLDETWGLTAASGFHDPLPLVPPVGKKQQ